MDEPREAFRPPIMAFATLANFFDDLASRPLPPQIDRSMMSSKSGTDQKNLLMALSTFSLIGEQQRVMPALQALATTDAEQRKTELAKLVREYYPDAVTLSEAHGTQQQLDDVFKDKFGLDTSADTRRKAITFFLHAARAADLPISANFPNTRSGSGGPGTPHAKRSRNSRKQTPAGAGAAAGISSDSADPPPSLGGSQFSTDVKIKAGLVVLTVDVNPIELRGEDRKFFYSLIDMMEDYASAHPASPTANGAAPNGEDEGGSS